MVEGGGRLGLALEPLDAVPERQFRGKHLDGDLAGEVHFGGEIHHRHAALAQEPFDLELLEAVTSAVARPVVAAGEPEAVEDVFDALMIGNADGVLVGPSARLTVRDIREYIGERGMR